MSLKIDRMQLEIIINNDQARKSLRHLEEETRRLKKELRKVPEGSDEWNKINDRLKAIKQQHDGIIKNLGLEKLSIRELGQRQKELNAIMRNLDPSTKAYRDLEKQLVAIKKRQGELRTQTNKTGLSLNKMANGFNKYFGIVTAGIASLSGLVMAGKKSITMFAEFDDKVTDVMKTTGRTKDEVYAINEELKNIDTRTAQEELLDLAYVAGKLGITAKEEIEGFVRATDQISVALKKDLGGNTEEAVRHLGKLVDLFKVKDKYGIEEGLLKVGSAINDLGMASTANEGFLVEFSKRVAGIAPSAGVAIEDILGLGATLDQLGQTSEVSSTVYTMVMTGMHKKTTEFARVAKMDIKSFTDLLKTDANEAFIRVMEGLQGDNAGMQELVENLGEVGLEGRRSTAVLGVLANNTHILRQQQELASKAFEKGTSITEEYNIKNQSAQAILEKKRKVLNNLAVELGEKLIPILTVSTSAFSYFVKATIAIIEFTTKYIRILAPLVAGITAYGIAVKVAANWERIHTGFMIAKNAVQKTAAFVTGVLTGKINLATIAQKAWNLAQKMNPIGMIVGVLAAAGTALYLYSKRLSAAEKLQKSLNDLNIEANKSIAEQKVELERLFRIAKNRNLADEDRIKAIEKINEISPDYLGNINLENINTDKATKAKENYIKALLKEARAKAAQEKLIEVEKKLIDLRMDSSSTELSWHQSLWNMIKAGGNSSVAMAYDLQTQIGNYTNENETLLAQQQALLEMVDQGNEQIIKTVVDGEDKAATVIKNKWGQTFEQYKEYLNEREDMLRVLASTRPEQDAPTMTNKEAWGQNFRSDEEEIPETTGLELLQEMMNRQKEQLAEQRAEGKITQQQYNEELENMEFAHLATMINLRRQLGMDTLDLEKKLNQMRIQNQEKTEQELIEKQQRMVERFMDFTKIGSAAIEDFMNGNEDALLEGGKAMINFALDILKQQMQIAIAGATMQSLVQPDSIVTFGISGLARAAVMVALIESAFAAAKGAVSRIGKNSSDAYADGNYQDVITKSGGHYRAQVVSPNHRSGLFSNPTFVPGFGLFGETAQPELVFNPRDTAAIMNAPGLVNAINATLGSVVPQYARGNAREIIRESNTTVDPTSIQIMAELRDELRKGIQAKLIASETYYRTHNEGADRLNDFKQKLP
jgi:TP901 family phage tail tape measure protein